MNNLSWLLYAADVTGGVNNVLSTASFGTAIGGTATIVGRAIRNDFDNIRRAEKAPLWKGGWKASSGFYKVAFACALAASIIPSKTTIYAIAASEMGENVLKSQTGNKAVKALNAWLDKQIAGETKPTP